MSRRRKFKQPRGHSRQLIFDRPIGIQLEFLLDLYLKVVGDYDLELDMKLDKIKMSLTGDKEKSEEIAQNLMKLQGQLLKATLEDGSGRYHYEQDLFPKLFKNQVQTKLLNEALNVMGYESELSKDKTLITNVNVRELVAIQKKIYQTSQMVKLDENKDIQNFLTLIMLYADRSSDQIIQTGLDLEVLGIKDERLYFAVDKQIAFEKIILKLTNSPPKQLLSKVDEVESFNDSFGFDGGKIVFINEGENLEQSSYDSEWEDELNQ